MPGAYCGPRCPACRAKPGPDCPDAARATRNLRHADRAQLHRHVDDLLGHEVGPLPWEGVAPTDCIHGCNGGHWADGTGCSDRCTFVCHESSGADD